MSSLRGLRGPSFLPELEGPGRLQICRDKVEGKELGRRIIVTFGSRHAIRYDLEDNSVVAGYYCPTFLRLSTPLAYDSSLSSYVCGVNSGKELLIWDGKEIKLQNIINNHKTGNPSNIKEGEKGNVETIISFKSNKQAIGLTFLTDVKNDQQGPECYVIFKNGSVQTVKYLLDSSINCEDGKDEVTPEEMRDVPSNSIRLDTSIFLLDDNSHSIRIAHAYMLGKNAYVRVNRVILDAETGKIHQSNLSTIDLQIDHDIENEANTTCTLPPIAFYGQLLTYITLKGDLVYLDILDKTSKKVLSCLSKSDENDLGLDPMNLAPDKDQCVGVQLLDSTRIAIVGPRKDGEGYAITVVEAVFDVVLASTKIKTVHAKKDAEQPENGNVSYLMLCHGKERIFFKHGSEVANVILDGKLPDRLSGFIGHETNLDVLPPKIKTLEPVDLTSTVEDDSEIPKWEIIQSGTENKYIGEASQALDLYRRMPEILAKRDFSSIETILDNYTDIPELLLLNIIECLINERFTQPKQLPKGEKESDTTLGWTNHKSLVKALNVSITETLMTQHIRQSNFELVTNLLTWIVKELKNPKKRTEEIRVDQCLLWIGLILNSHYTNFILSKSNKKVKDLILTTQKLVEETQSTMDTLSSTLPLTKMICDASKAKLSSNAASSAAVVGLLQSSSIVNNLSNMANRSYSIEIVEF